MSCRYHVRSPIDLILIAAAFKCRSPGSAECPQCTSKFTCAVCPDPRSGVQPLLPRGRQEPSLPPCIFSTSVKPVVSPQQAVLSFASICWLAKLPSPAGTGCGTLPCFVCEGQGYVNTKVLLLSATLWFILHCYATSCGDCSLGVQAGPSSLAGLAVMHATARSVSVLSAASLHALSFRQQQSACRSAVLSCMQGLMACPLCGGFEGQAPNPDPEAGPPGREAKQLPEMPPGDLSWLDDL